MPDLAPPELNMIRVLCIGDVVGGTGRRAVRELVPVLRQRHGLALVIANAENAAGGVGLTIKTARELLDHGVDVITNGNHVWKYKEILSLLDSEPRVLRPLNYPPGTPGRGHGVFTTEAGHKVAVLNLEGRAFMDPLPCPFAAADQALEQLRQQTPVVVTDLHAEATSEKRAMGWHLDGRVSALFGTHTHVQTADNEVLPQGTGYITDLGMTGPHHSVIGARVEPVLTHFRTLRPAPFGVAKHDVRLCGALFEIDADTGHAVAVTRVKEALTP